MNEEMYTRDRYAPIDLIVLQKNIHQNCVKSPGMSKYFEDFAVDFLTKFDSRVEILAYHTVEFDKRYHVVALVNGEELASCTINYQDELCAELSRDRLSQFLLTLCHEQHRITAMIDRQNLNKKYESMIVRETEFDAL